MCGALQGNEGGVEAERLSTLHGVPTGLCSACRGVWHPYQPQLQVNLVCFVPSHLKGASLGCGLSLSVQTPTLMPLQAFRQNAWQQVQAPKGDLRAMAKLYEGL